MVFTWKLVRVLVDGKVCRRWSRAGGVVVEEADIQVPDPCGMTTTTEFIVGRHTMHVLA